MLDTGVHATLEDLAKAKGVNASYVSRVLRLTLLAPDIFEAIDGRQPAEMQLDDMLKGFPLEWEGQRRACDRATSGRSGSTVIGLGLVADGRHTRRPMGCSTRLDGPSDARRADSASQPSASGC